MFFDTPREAEPFDASYIEIARLQKQLLSLRYDAAQRIPRPLPVRRKGLFGRETVWPDGYEPTAQRLQAAQQALGAQRRAAGYANDLCWWSLPWEQAAPALLQMLTLPQEEDEPDETGWRHSVSFWPQPGQDGRQLLCLGMRAHKQEHSSSRHTQDVEHSAYTRAEREALVGAYNQRRNAQAAAHMYFGNGTGVYSVPTGWSYDTAAAYYASPEYMAERMRSEVQYSESLYTVEEQRVLHVSSNSQDRVSVHAVCEYRIDAGGTLDWLAPLDFAELQATSGDATPAAALQQRDAAVLAALWLAAEPSLQRVPLSLFAAGYDKDNYADVMRLAGVLTCLADKLTGG